MHTAIERIKAFPITNGEITDVQWVNGVEPLVFGALTFDFENPGGYYKVELRLHPTEQSDIRVVVCLPEQKVWNGKFLGTGNGGAAGNIWIGQYINGVSRGYATATTNLGTSPEPYDCIGKMEVLKDFGHRATHLMTVVGKQLTEWFYGKAPAYSYFLGGSTGGQQAMSEAQRYPEDYDGIVCMSPAYNRVKLHAWFVWNWQNIHKVKDGAFTPEQAQAWNECIVKVYKEQCGSNPDDAFLCYPGRIRENPMDHPALQEDIERLLTSGQAQALRALYDGPVDRATGEPFITPFLPGSESEGLSLVDISNKESFYHTLLFPFYWAWGKDFDLMEFDFHHDLARAIEELSPILDATNPDLSAFNERGGKLLVIGGSCDAIIPYTDFLNYYRQVEQKQGGLEKTMEFFRFFLLPGFGHTSGGKGVKDIGTLGIKATPRDAEHDMICAMERWVEQGVAPDRLLGTYWKMNEKGLAFDYDRPAYVYPYIAEFTGGDPKNAENYKAVLNENSY